MQTIAISQIKPYPANAKKHPDRQVQKIADSIREFGFNQPIVLDKDMVIIVGHGRFEGAKMLGMKEGRTDSPFSPPGADWFPILRLDLPEDKATAYRLADNKLNESPWDMEIVVAELQKLTAPLVELTGFSISLTKGADAEQDSVPAVPIVPQTKKGDVYELGGHRLVCGDATSADDVKKVCNDRPVDMLLTDPPYGVSYVGKTKDALKIQNDEKQGEDLHAFLKDTFVLVHSVMKAGATFYVCCPAGSIHRTFLNALHDADLEVHQGLVWHKNSMVLGRSDYHYSHEPILYGWRGGSKSPVEFRSEASKRFRFRSAITLIRTSHHEAGGPVRVSDHQQYQGRGYRIRSVPRLRNHAHRLPKARQDLLWLRAGREVLRCDRPAVC
jgi:site-specific DNA-methyltransferase (adenine-specific)